MQRRDFLRRAPVALAAIGAPVAAATIAAPAENPALLALGEELPKVEQTYQDALTAWRTAWDFWSPAATQASGTRTRARIFKARMASPTYARLYRRSGVRGATGSRFSRAGKMHITVHVQP